MIGVDDTTSSLKEQTINNKTFCFLLVLTAWILTKKALLEAVGQSSDEKYTIPDIYIFKTFGKLLSSKDNKKAIGKLSFMNSNTIPC